MTPKFALSAHYALDNLAVMSGMDSENVPLIYVVPAYNSQRIYQAMAGGFGAGAKLITEIAHDYEEIRNALQAIPSFE